MSPTDQLPTPTPAQPGVSSDPPPVVRELVEQFRTLWEQGQPLDTHAFLARHPAGPALPELLLDLAYEEYCLRVEAGETIDPLRFCERFPDIQQPLGNLIVTHGWAANRPELERGLTAPPAWPEPGQTLLGFTLLRELGRGGLSRVYLASQLDLGERLVVIKVTPLGTTEAQTLGRLQHRHIVPVNWVQQDPAAGLTVIIMPFLGSVTLDDVLRRLRAGSWPARGRALLEAVGAVAYRQQLPPVPLEGRSEPHSLLVKGEYLDAAVHLGVQLAEALAYTHDRGIYHRDLKPSNVLLSPEGSPMLLDFNLSFDPRHERYELGGTLDYMAPEQLRACDRYCPGDRRAVDARSDLFSLGVVLYELLSGTLPFKSGWMPFFSKDDFYLCSLMLRDQQKKGPPPLRRANPQVDAALARVIERCLAYDPARRPQSARELAAALRASLSGLGRARRWLGTHRRAVLAAVCAALVLSAAGTYAVVQREPYSQRQLSCGWDFYHKGEYHQAIECFSRALAADPSFAEGLFARGRAYQQMGEFQEALADYAKASELVDDGRIHACRGYCYNRKRYHREALWAYSQAIRAGFATAAVFNNQAYSYIELRELENQAEQCLERALHLDPSLRAAYHNRAVLRGKKAVQQTGRLPDEVLADLRKAMQLGPDTAELYYDAALLSGRAAIVDRSRIEPALDYLQQALARGFTPKSWQAEPAFTALRQEQRFLALLNRPASSHPPPLTVRLVDPLGDQAD